MYLFLQALIPLVRMQWCVAGVKMLVCPSLCCFTVMVCVLMVSVAVADLLPLLRNILVYNCYPHLHHRSLTLSRWIKRISGSLLPRLFSSTRVIRVLPHSPNTHLWLRYKLMTITTISWPLHHWHMVPSLRWWTHWNTVFLPPLSVLSVSWGDNKIILIHA